MRRKQSEISKKQNFIPYEFWGGKEYSNKENKIDRLPTSLNPTIIFFQTKTHKNSGLKNEALNN
jgi:hypothetical protein